MSAFDPTPPGPSGAALGSGPARTSGKAVTAMVLGIVGLLLGWILLPLACCALAIVFGSLALRDIGREGGRLGGRGQATAGLVLGVLGLAGWALVILAHAVGHAV